MQETWVQSLGQKDPLEKGLATRSSILAWEISWTEEPGGLLSMGFHKSRTRLSDFTSLSIISYGKTWTKVLANTIYFPGFPCGSVVKNLSAKQETQMLWVRFLNHEDPLEKGMTTYSSVLAWRIPQTEEPGGLQSTGSQRAGHDSATKQQQSVIHN